MLNFQILTIFYPYCSGQQSVICVTHASFAHVAAMILNIMDRVLTITSVMNITFGPIFSSSFICMTPNTVTIPPWSYMYISL